MDLSRCTRRRLAAVLAAPVVALTLGASAALAQPAGASPDDQAALLKRVQEYWNLVKDNDRLAAWKYEAQSKEPNAGALLNGYLKRSGVAYNTVEAQEVASMEAGQAIVKVRMNYSVPLMRINNTEAVLDDPWRLIDGAWYHAPRANR